MADELDTRRVGRARPSAGGRNPKGTDKGVRSAPVKGSEVSAGTGGKTPPGS